MHFISLLLVCWCGLGCATVQVKQHTLQKKYQVGDSADLYCNITSDKEAVEGCTMMWEIWDENADILVDISNIPKYNQRINVIYEDTFTFMSVKDLMVTDTEKIFCTATCFVNERLQYITDNGTILTVTEQEPKPALPWLKYLIFSINLLIFTFVLGIFILIIRKSSRQK